MKIGFVSPYDFAYPGGVSAHILHLTKHFARNGQQVKIIAPCSNISGAPTGVEFLPVGRPFPLPSGGSIARVALSLRLAPRVRAILEAERFDILHLHEPLVPVLPITFLRFSQATNVGTFHAYHGRNIFYRYTRPLLRRWVRKLHGRIAVSQPAMEYISKYFPGHYQIIPNGIDVEHFSPKVRPIEALRDGRLNILFVGRVGERRKGLRYLLGAFGRLRWDFPNARVIVVGPGSLDEESARLISERGLQDLVTLVGEVTQDMLPQHYASADIFCAPATGKESQGVVLLEALASGKPIVASHIPGYASVLENGSNALLVPPKKEEALASALATLLADKDLREEMGARGRAHVLKYSWELVSRQVMDYYLWLLQRQPSWA